MEMQQALLQEFAARKEQVLNLEVRLFLLVLAIEAFFVLIYVFNLARVRQSSGFALASTSVYFVLFFELVAINGKMGLISMYLRQMEQHMAGIGYIGLVWESKALDMIIFRPGNAFTLPAGLTIFFLLGQTLFVTYLQVSHFTCSARAKLFLNVVLAVLLILLVAKTISVDFYRKLPQVFGEGNEVRTSIDGGGVTATKIDR
ncbi:MAG: hypothetical protein NT106_04415 [Candidatus Sumerlaeota bacterium]|nr:hypothetical protein [Candidatus Sumerlaeota bacterium]